MKIGQDFLDIQFSSILYNILTMIVYYKSADLDGLACAIEKLVGIDHRYISNKIISAQGYYHGWYNVQIAYLNVP